MSRPRSGSTPVSQPVSRRGSGAGLAAGTGSRICHDLISPIGAIGNGLELLSLQGAGGAERPEYELIVESVAQANARIRFFRIAYGVCLPDQQIRQDEVRDLLAALYSGGRLTVDWNGPATAQRALVKAALLGFQCAESAAPYGGSLVVRLHDDGFHLRLDAPRLRAEPRLWAMLDPSPGAETDAGDCRESEIQFPLLAQHLHDLGRQAQYAFDDRMLELTV